MYIDSAKPLVVLVNKNSASGAEIIAAGVRANGVGTVMGTQTAGCVGIGQPRELPDGGLLLVTHVRGRVGKEFVPHDFAFTIRPKRWLRRGENAASSR